MSNETLTALNQNTLIGYTAQRGNAWHYRASEQGAEPNHYEGAIPVEDVRRRLFHWSPIEAEVTATALTPEGVLSITDPTRKAIVRPDTGTILGMFREGYRVHPYGEWLIDAVEPILGDLAIGSAGLLKGGAVAWVQVEVAESLKVAGIEFRPFLTAATSLDGSLSTSYITGAQVVVCDNTLSFALGTAKDTFRLRHTAGSLDRLADAQAALATVYGVGDAYAARLAALAAEKVSPARWKKFLDAYTRPLAAVPTDRQKTAAQRLADELDAMWRSDERAAPWKGTALGVVQAANTFLHHGGVVRGAPRSERNAERALDGTTAKADARILAVLASV